MERAETEREKDLMKPREKWERERVLIRREKNYLFSQYPMVIVANTNRTILQDLLENSNQQINSFQRTVPTYKKLMFRQMPSHLKLS